MLGAGWGARLVLFRQVGGGWLVRKIATGRGVVKMTKSIQGKRNSWRRKLVTIAVASCFAAEAAYANPLGPTVVNGQVSFSSERQSAADHQHARRDHQLAGFFDLGQRDHQVCSAVGVKFRDEPRHGRGSVRDPGFAAVERARVPDQSQRHQLWRRLAGQHGGIGRIDAWACRTRIFWQGAIDLPKFPGAGGIVNQGVITTPQAAAFI